MTDSEQNKTNEPIQNGHASSPSLQEGETNQTDQIQAALSTAKSEIKEKENRYMYLYAEFENFKKRALKERSDLLKFGWESIARELLQTLDNFERALEHAPKELDPNFLSGIKMIQGQLSATLQKQGITPIETQNKLFDPNFHEAIAQEPSTESAGTITRIEQKGYLLHGRLLRPARVVISSGNAGLTEQKNDSISK